eukprot:jgi/Mesvir1/28785/Mv09262-RA.1
MADQAQRLEFEGSQLAVEAVELDRQGRYAEAIPKYKRAAEIIAQIATSDAQRTRGQEYIDRARALEQLLQRQQMENMATAADVVSRGTRAVGEANAAVKRAGGWKPVAGAAAVAAVAGAVLVGPMTAVASAVGGAYLATREDSAGEIARSVGSAAVGTVEKAREINARHQLGEKAVAAAHAVGRSVAEANQKYQVTEKVGAALQKGMGKAKELEEKHNLTERAASAVSSSLDTIARTVASPSHGSQRAQPGAGAGPHAASAPPAHPSFYPSVPSS